MLSRYKLLRPLWDLWKLLLLLRLENLCSTSMLLKKLAEVRCYCALEYSFDSSVMSLWNELNFMWGIGPLMGVDENYYLQIYVEEGVLKLSFIVGILGVIIVWFSGESGSGVNPVALNGRFRVNASGLFRDFVYILKLLNGDGNCNVVWGNTSNWSLWSTDSLGLPILYRMRFILM